MNLLLAVEAAEEAEEVTNPILPTTNEIVWGAIFFALLFVLVKYVLLPPVRRTLDARSEKIRGDREAAQAARAGAGAVVTDYDDQLAGARAEAAAIVDGARAEAEQERQRILSAVEAEVSVQREAAMAEIAAAKADAMSRLRPQVTQLAVGAASRVIDRPLDPQNQVPVIDRYLDSAN
jgi:F-type H+-transporting ATPase subunit b